MEKKQDNKPADHQTEIKAKLKKIQMVRGRFDSGASRTDLFCGCGHSDGAHDDNCASNNIDE